MNDNDKTPTDEIAETLLEKAKVTYLIRVPASAAARIEADAKRRGITPSRAAAEAAIRGSYIVPRADEDQQP